jgi:hypothetical protein
MDNRPLTFKAEGRMKLLNVSATFALACFSKPSWASDFTGCSVVKIIVDGDQNGFVQVSCPTAIAGLPACATAPAYVGFDKSPPAGKQYLSLMPDAQATSTKVDGNINHTVCSVWQSNVALLTALVVGN